MPRGRVRRRAVSLKRKLSPIRQTSIKRRFGGKTFTNVASKSTKRAANERAAGWRQQGSLARTVKVKGGYDIYVNP